MSQLKSEDQLALMPKRIEGALGAFSKAELSKFLWDHSCFGKVAKAKKHPEDKHAIRILVVGSGGSYPAALAVAHVLRDDMRSASVETTTPLSAIQTLKQFDNIANCTWFPEYDVIIGISYSGRTKDIIELYHTVTFGRKKYPFLLITGADKADLRDLYVEHEDCKIISYYNVNDFTGKEDSMISLAPTLIPAILVNNDTDYEKYLREGKKFVDSLDISSIAASIKKVPVVHVLYDWKTYPFAACLDSMLTESGIANVVMHEKKDFSHGRASILYKQEFAVVFNLVSYHAFMDSYTLEKSFEYENNYDKLLSDFLRHISGTRYIEIGNAMQPGSWNIRAMCMLPYFITAIGKELDIDISEPPTKSNWTSRLYDYNEGF